MTRQRIQRWFTVLCIGLMGITSLAVVAQFYTEPEESGIVVTGFRSPIAYVAPGAGGKTDIHVIKLRAAVEVIDDDNDPATPRVVDPAGYTITNITNTPEISEIDPMYSPSGNLLLFRGDADATTYPGMNSLFVSDTEGLEKIQVTPNGVNVFYGSFSPNETQVAFMAQWGSNQFKIYRSDIDGGNQFTLTPGEGFNAAFPLWRWNGNGAGEIAYLRFDGAMSQVAAIDPLTAEEVWSTDPVNEQWWILQPLYGPYGTLIRRENTDSAWNVATINLDTKEVTQITSNTTNTCCLTMPMTDWVPTDTNWTLFTSLTETTISDVCATRSSATVKEIGLAIHNYDSGETVQLPENAVDNVCAVWSVDGTITTDMTALGISSDYEFSDTESGNWELVARLTETTMSDFCTTWNTADVAAMSLGAQNLYSGETVPLTESEIDDFCADPSEYGRGTYLQSSWEWSVSYLSDTEEGGRDIYSANPDGSNPVNLTEFDEREYTSVQDLSYLDYTGFADERASVRVDTLLVGYNGNVGDEEPTPWLGFTWDITRRESGGDYELLFLTNGSDPDVADPISLAQLEQLAADGVARVCQYYVDSDESNIKVYSSPSESAPVVRSLEAGELVQANGLLPGFLSIPKDWLHLTDGTWVKKEDVLPSQEDCPPLPMISRYSSNL